MQSYWFVFTKWIWFLECSLNHEHLRFLAKKVKPKGLHLNFTLGLLQSKYVNFLREPKYLWAYTSYSRSRNLPACSLHIYWHSVRLSPLLPFYMICMIFQLSSAYSTHQAEQNKHFSPFFRSEINHATELRLLNSSSSAYNLCYLTYLSWVE